MEPALAMRQAVQFNKKNTMTTNSITGQTSAIKLVISLLPNDRLVSLTTQWTKDRSGVACRWIIGIDRMTIEQHYNKETRKVRLWKMEDMSVKEWFLTQLDAIRATSSADAVLVLLA
jgi:hypothetical protein